MAYTHERIRQILKDTAEKCILPYFRNLTEDQIDTKAHAGDFVTIADRTAELHLNDVLRDLLPGSLVLGEEAYSEDKSVMERCAAADDVWIVDPVDGTGNFKNGNDNFCTILAHAHKGDLVGAWVYLPVTGKFAAWKKGDAVTINGKPVNFDTSEKPLNEMIIADHLGWGYPQDKAQLVKNRAFFKERHTVYSFGIETVMMMENELDCVSFSPCNPWDISACVAMVSASGGKVLRANEKPIRGATLFQRDGAFVATRSPGQWEDVRDKMLTDVDKERYYA